MALWADKIAICHRYLFVPIGEQTAGVVGALSDLVHAGFSNIEALSRQTNIIHPPCEIIGKRRF